MQARARFPPPVVAPVRTVPTAPSTADFAPPHALRERDPDALTQTRALLERVRAARAAPAASVTLSALASRVAKSHGRVRPGDALTPFERMNQCRAALERLDVHGWKRSYHQRLFHEDFLVFF